jgi:dienelactone hydrolase
MPKHGLSPYRLYGANALEELPFGMDFQEDLRLPDVLTFDSGKQVQIREHWATRRLEVHQKIVPIAYGDIPVPTTPASGVVLHEAAVKFADARLITCQVANGLAHDKRSFLLRLYIPKRPGRLPVVLNGDACWHCATDEVIGEILRRGWVFAQFDRVEIAADGPGEVQPSTPFTDSNDSGDPRSPAAVAWWAWAYHRAVDALSAFDFVNSAAIAVVGHSRGGKAALLAGATDERIAVTGANNSGAGGAGCFRGNFPGAESLADLLAKFPHWLKPALKEYIGRESELPFDQHFLKALIAPRPLLTTEALGDRWANPAGTWQTYLAAQPVYALLGAKENIAIAFRDGDHAHTFADWCCFLDFASVFLDR